MLFENYDDILTVEGLMEVLDIGKHTAYALLKSGKIQGFKLGRVWKIPKPSVERYVLRSCKNYYIPENDDGFQKS